MISGSVKRKPCTQAKMADIFHIYKKNLDFFGFAFSLLFIAVSTVFDPGSLCAANVQFHAFFPLLAFSVGPRLYDTKLQRPETGEAYIV